MNDSLASIIGLNIDPALNPKTRLKIGNGLSRFNGRGRSIKTISTDLLFPAFQICIYARRLSVVKAAALCKSVAQGSPLNTESRTFPGFELMLSNAETSTLVSITA